MLIRDTFLIVFPALIGYLFIFFFIQYPKLIEYELITTFSLIIGGVYIGWLFRKEQGDSSIGICLKQGKKLYIRFFLHSIYLTFIFTCITIIINIFLGSNNNAISSAPFLIVIKVGLIIFLQKWISIYAPMIIGNWLYGWWQTAETNNLSK